MEKMQTIYSANPALGDVKQVELSLQSTHTKLEALGVELEKFQVSLAVVGPYQNDDVIS